MNKSRLLLYLSLSILFTVSCQKVGEKFEVSGTITEAADTTLYLEHLTLAEGAVAIDSLRLDEDGQFTLRGPRPTNPEFYRLRIGRQVVNLSIDSTEHITVEAALPHLSLGYRVQGSGNCDTIRLLALKLDTLRLSLQRVADDRSLTLAERQQRIEQLVHDYKTDVKLRFVQNRYDRASSYYAMFQMLGGQMVFDPVSDPSDVTWFTALANAWEANYPDLPRTQNLANIALQGHRNTRRHTIQIDLDSDKVSETGIVDMGFPDKAGRERRLSDLRGQVVLLDFTAYDLKGTPERTLLLRELYNKYHARGLEIYQVSLDADEHYWKTMSDALPWVCVYDAEGLQNDIVRIYNLQTLPTWFLVDRGSNLVGRMGLMDEDLEHAIKRLLENGN